MYLIDRYHLISLLIKLSYAYFKIREEISLNANFSIVSRRLIITKKIFFFFSSITVKSEGYKGIRVKFDTRTLSLFVGLSETMPGVGVIRST